MEESKGFGLCAEKPLDVYGKYITQYYGVWLTDECSQARKAEELLEQIVFNWPQVFIDLKF